MLTRFEVSGFKNLHQVAIDFGPFTCIAGPNAVGKSNLFDAIELLSRLAEHTFLDALSGIRPTSSRIASLETVLSRDVMSGTEPLSLAAEMLLPSSLTDDYGQPIAPSRTLVRYEIRLRAVEDARLPERKRLRLEHESLAPLLPARDTKPPLCLEGRWPKLVIDGAVSGRVEHPFLDSMQEDGRSVVKIFHDNGVGRGAPRKVFVVDAQRSVLSGSANSDTPTLLAAKREMLSWRFLALDPHSMRSPDSLMERASVSSTGAHVPAALHRQDAVQGGNGRVYERVRDTLRQLVDVRSLTVAEDPVTDTLELRARIAESPELPARSLSEGTLRFLALATMHHSADYFGLLCMEEPENGIHPSSILDMARLLATMPEGDSFQRQVIVNTHSPYFVQAMDDHDLLCAVPKMSRTASGTYATHVAFHPLKGSWRTQLPDSARSIPKSQLAAYLENPATWDSDDE